MKKTSLIICGLAAVCMAFASPVFRPADGVYFVGNPVSGAPVVTCPTMVTGAYQARFLTNDALVASARVAGEMRSLATYLKNDTLNLRRFMGVGAIQSLTVRNAKAEKYELGDLSEHKTWTESRLWAAYDYTTLIGSRYLPLAVYNPWDCTILYDADPALSEQGELTQRFGFPGEGLVIQGIEFMLLSDIEQPLAEYELVLTLMVGNDSETHYLNSTMLTRLDDIDGHHAFACRIETETQLPQEEISIRLSGFSTSPAWLPRAVNTAGLYPYSHTTYGEQTMGELGGDVCINLIGYYNYLGDWGIPSGKQERGEVVNEGDLVQIYYSPDEEGYIDRFMGEAAFPVECTFGMSDIALFGSPAWIESSIDDSQWAEYEALQIIMQAEALPADVPGRLGKVVFTTRDLASQYTILVVQGNAWFDDDPDTALEQADAVTRIPAEGGFYDLLGRSLSAPIPGQPCIINGEKRILIRP